MRLKRRLVATILLGYIVSGPVMAMETQVYPQGEGFTAGEHVMIGDEVKLNLTAGGLLHLPNGLALSYGEIVSLGDFYGVPGEAIADGKTHSDRAQRFIAAFTQFSVSATVIEEVHKILEITLEERDAVREALAHGESVAEVYKRISEDHNRRYNCVTGGGCDGKWWLKQGRYLELAKTDYDHFGESAWIAYQAGHALAIAQALKAHETRDQRMLELAYAMNAFACHFLSDKFAAGHMRTPRRALDIHTTPALIGSLLSHYMHNEEGLYGLHVHNNRGERWPAYGDKHYFDKENAQHRHILQEAMQTSADEVFLAYKTGASTESEMDGIVPATDVNHDQRGDDIAPMFYWDEATAKLYRRKELANPRSFEFTDDWWGWSTFLELGRIYGLPHGLSAKTLFN